jgi:hypothetical protein
VAQSVGVTTLGLVGETIKGPAFEPVFITNYDEFQAYFGGTEPVKFVNTQIPKYEAAYIAKSYLQQSNQLFVTRVLGLSGYDAGPSWSIRVTANVDPTTINQSPTSSTPWAASFTGSTTGGTIVPTRTDNVGNITINLETAAGTIVTGGTSPSSILNLTVAPSTRFSTGVGLPRLHKQGGIITVEGTIAVTATGSISWGNGANIGFLQVPVGYQPTIPAYFSADIYTYTAASPSIPTGVSRGMVTISGTSLIVTLINPSGTLSFTAGDSFEIIIGGNSYKL